MSDPAPLMLGVSGLRGIVGQSLTPDVVARFAGALGAWLLDRAERTRGWERAKKRGRPIVLIGRDGRFGGDAIQSAAAAGLAASGCDATVCGVMMTPTLAVAVDAKGFSAGLMVTASHNPQEWNGLKVVLPDARARGQDVSAAAPGKTVAEELIARFRDERPPWATSWERTGEIQELPEGLPGAMHMARLNEALPSRHEIKERTFLVALDCVGGSGAIATPTYLGEALGCRVRVSGDYTDGLFTHTPEPTAENLAAFCTVARRAKAAVGFAQDPDADRLAIVDERGRYIGEEYTLALAAEALLGGRKARGPKGRGGRVLVTNLSTSRMLDDIAARHSARIVRTPVGEANVVEAMKREKAAGHDVVLGGEGNGGVIWPRVTYVRDSLSAMGLVLALMARTGKKVSELVADIPAYAIEKRKVELARKEHARPAVEKLAAAYEGQNADLQDGIRVDWADRKAWLHVRASNTEPIMRLIAEAPTPAESQAILDEAARIVAG